MPHSPTRARWGAMPLAVAMSLALAVPAAAQVATLASPDESPSPAPGSVVTELAFADREEALLAFARCMRDNGIDMDDPQVSGGEGGGRFLRGAVGGRGGLDDLSEEFMVAQEACGPILEAARPDIDPVEEQERLEEQLLLAQCLRDNGYPEYPDPMLAADGRLQRGGSRFAELGIDFRSEAFQEARTACADELQIDGIGPGGGPGGLAGGRE